MLRLLAAGVVLAIGGCSAAMPPPATVTWQYGAGNGDGVAYAGPKPVFSRAFGMGNGDSVTSGQTATTQYSYGGENQSGSMVQLGVPTPAPVQRLAAPTPAPGQVQAVPGTHS